MSAGTVGGMSEWTPEGIAIGISIVAALLALASAVYTRSQAKVSERTRALEHDASWRIFWLRVAAGRRDNNTGEYPKAWGLFAQNIGRGDALDFSAAVDGVAHDLSHQNGDIAAGGRVRFGIVTGRKVELRWTERDGKKRRVTRHIPEQPVVKETTP